MVASRHSPAAAGALALGVRRLGVDRSALLGARRSWLTRGGSGGASRRAERPSAARRGRRTARRARERPPRGPSVRSRPRPRRAGAVRDRAAARSARRSTSRSAWWRATRSGSRRSSSCSPAVFFVLTMMTYVEGNSLHPERGGASTFARYAFNELWSFVAGWAILLDYLIVMAIGVVRRSRTTWRSSGHGPTEGACQLVIAAGGARVRGRVEHPRPLGGPARHRASARRCSTSSLLVRDRGCRRWRSSGTPARSPTRSTSASAPTWDDLIFGLGRRDRRADGHRGGLGARRRDPRGPPRRCGALVVLGTVAMLVCSSASRSSALMALPVHRRPARRSATSCSRRRCWGWSRAFEPALASRRAAATWSARSAAVAARCRR